MLLIAACGGDLPRPSPLPPVLANPTFGSSGTFGDLFGDDWAIALVTSCPGEPRQSWIDGLDTSDLPCLDPDERGPHFILVDSAGQFVRRYEAKWLGSYIVGCYPPTSPWSSDSLGYVQFGPEGKVACPDENGRP